MRREGAKIIAKGVWPDVPVEQIWQIELLNNAEFSWKVSLNIKEAVEISEGEVRFFFSELYNSFFSKFGRLNLPEGFREDEFDMLQRCISTGEIGLNSSNYEMPGIGLCFEQGLNNFAKVFNSDIAARARILSINNVRAESDAFLQPGVYSYFAIKGRVSEENVPLIQETEKELRQGPLKVRLDNGRGCIYWKTKQLTKKLGLYTSLRVNGRWHESSRHAVWSGQKQQGAFIYNGQWLDLPIAQQWRVKIITDNMIECRIKLIVHEEIEVDRLQTNLMLTEAYSCWRVDAEQGEFSSFDADANDDWQIDCGRHANQTVLSVNSMPNEWPEVRFHANTAGKNAQLRVLNSDMYHRGRILQYVVPLKQTIAPGEYDYFSGNIIIEGK